MLHNPFEPQTEKDRREIEKNLRESGLEYNRVIIKARQCLELPQFKEYKDNAEKLAEKLFNVFCDTPSKDPVTESLRIRINGLRDLGIRVYQDASKQPRVVKTEKKEALDEK